MKRMDYREGSEMLRKAGFTTLEIEQLSKLRSRYSDQETQQISGTHPCPKSDSWFEKVVQKISDIGSIWWML